MGTINHPLFQSAPSRYFITVLKRGGALGGHGQGQVRVSEKVLQLTPPKSSIRNTQAPAAVQPLQLQRKVR